MNESYSTWNSLSFHPVGKLCIFVHGLPRLKSQNRCKISITMMVGLLLWFFHDNCNCCVVAFIYDVQAMHAVVVAAAPPQGHWYPILYTAHGTLSTKALVATHHCCCSSSSACCLIVVLCVLSLLLLLLLFAMMNDTAATSVVAVALVIALVVLVVLVVVSIHGGIAIEVTVWLLFFFMLF